MLETTGVQSFTLTSELHCLRPCDREAFYRNQVPCIRVWDQNVASSCKSGPGLAIRMLSWGLAVGQWGAGTQNSAW